MGSLIVMHFSHINHMVVTRKMNKESQDPQEIHQAKRQSQWRLSSPKISTPPLQLCRSDNDREQFFCDEKIMYI
jgi:hypothetical protein